MVWKAVKLGARSFLTKPYSAEYAAMIIGELMNRGAEEGGGR